MYVYINPFFALVHSADYLICFWYRQITSNDWMYINSLNEKQLSYLICYISWKLIEKDVRVWADSIEIND